jgi:hypothetical protein
MGLVRILVLVLVLVGGACGVVEPRTSTEASVGVVVRSCGDLPCAFIDQWWYWVDGVEHVRTFCYLPDSDRCDELGCVLDEPVECRADR